MIEPVCHWSLTSFMALWYILTSTSKWMSTCFTSAAADRYFIRLNCLVSMQPWSCGLITSSIMQGALDARQAQLCPPPTKPLGFLKVGLGVEAWGGGRWGGGGDMSYRCSEAQGAAILSSRLAILFIPNGRLKWGEMNIRKCHQA